jgi:hypothetical protein
VSVYKAVARHHRVPVCGPGIGTGITRPTSQSETTRGSRSAQALARFSIGDLVGLSGTQKKRLGANSGANEVMP